MPTVLKIENQFLEQAFQFSGAEADTSHQDDFPLLFIWNLFCGAKYPKHSGNIAPEFNNIYM
jgi:hypothetical protein